MLWQPPLPEPYLRMSDEDLARRIRARKDELGDRLLVLGHHYQQDDVVRHADLTGDSLKLSQMAAEEARRRGSEWIVFCGVHFMAETADVLTDDSVKVVLPDLSAGCSMADMAQYDQAVEAWDAIAASVRGTRTRVVPITSCPTAERRAARWDPTNPPAPVKRMRIVTTSTSFPKRLFQHSAEDSVEDRAHRGSAHGGSSAFRHLHEREARGERVP